MRKKPLALLDANIIYSAHLRDLFVPCKRLTAHSLAGYRPRYVCAFRAKMTTPALAGGGELPAVAGLKVARSANKARHVLAAAIKGKCDFIITLNLADFPGDVLARHGIAAQSPDDFLAQLLDEIPDDVCSAIREIRTRLTSPRYSAREYLDMLEGQSLPQTLAALRKVNPSAL